MIQYSLVRQYLFGVTKAHWRVLPQLTVPVGAGAVFYFSCYDYFLHEENLMYRILFSNHHLKDRQNYLTVPV